MAKLTHFETKAEYNRYMRKAKWKSRGVKDFLKADELYENRTICEICGTAERLYLDHCHTSGLSRGILCKDCNMALGFFKDDKELLRKGVDYLGKIVYN